MTSPDPHERAERLAAESLAAGDATGWFERLYAEAEAEGAGVPWGGSPNRLLVGWAERKGLRGDGRRAVVVGGGLGDDAEYIAGLGFDTTAFDIAESAVRAARRRFPDSVVEYVAADLLHPRPDWQRAFDLVVEVFTIQVLPLRLRPGAIVQVANLVSRGGTLIAIARGRGEEDQVGAEPPWPLSRAELDGFAAAGLRPVLVEDFHPPEEPSVRRLRAEFVRLERD